MKFKLLFLFLFLVSIQAFAQDKKWSVETNYSITTNEGVGADDNILELGLKYRFADFNFLQLGVGINSGFAHKEFDGSDIDVTGDVRDFYFQSRVFVDFIIPGLEKLRPSIGLGYSVINTDTDVISIGEPINQNTTNGGFNLNLGLSYDITKRFFVQAQYDFINFRIKDEFIFQGELINRDFTEKANNIKIGIGYRF